LAFFQNLILDKKEWLIPQTPSIREKSHLNLGSITTHGGFNGKNYNTLFMPKSRKNATLWQINVSLKNMSQMVHRFRVIVSKGNFKVLLV
jgi:hypothetical protein